MTVRLVCASANPDKVTEMTAALDGIVELEPRPPELAEVVEDAPDLEGNARLKAVAVCDAAGRPAIADDTGLEVDALDGAPGVTSARYAGEGASYADNVTKLLSELEGVEHAERGARFRTVALVRWPDGSELAAEGEVVGRIAEAARGENGFGYDSVFVPVARVASMPSMSGISRSMKMTSKSDSSHARTASLPVAATLQVCPINSRIPTATS